MAPEVYLKALSMVRNVARQDGRQITNFTTLVCDLRHLPAIMDVDQSRDDPAYYFRPWKTMLGPNRCRGRGRLLLSGAAP